MDFFAFVPWHDHQEVDLWYLCYRPISKLLVGQMLTWNWWLKLKMGSKLRNILIIVQDYMWHTTWSSTYDFENGIHYVCVLLLHLKIHCQSCQCVSTSLDGVRLDKCNCKPWHRRPGFPSYPDHQYSTNWSLYSHHDPFRTALVACSGTSYMKEVRLDVWVLLRIAKDSKSRQSVRIVFRHLTCRSNDWLVEGDELSAAIFFNGHWHTCAYCAP